MPYGAAAEQLRAYIADLSALLAQTGFTNLLLYGLLGSLVAAAVLFWMHSNQ